MLHIFIYYRRSGVILDPSMISVAPSLSDQLPAAGYMPFLTGTTGGPVDGIPPLNMMDVSYTEFIYSIAIALFLSTYYPFNHMATHFI